MQPVITCAYSCCCSQLIACLRQLSQRSDESLGYEGPGEGKHQFSFLHSPLADTTFLMHTNRRTIEQRRTKFRAPVFGSLLVSLIFPVYMVAFLSPDSIPYTIGCLFPLSLLAVWTFASRRRRFSSILNDQSAQLFSMLCLIAGLVTWYVEDKNYWISWFTSGFVFFLFTNFFHNLMVFTGIHGQSEDEVWR